MPSATPLEEALAALEQRPESLPPRTRPGLSRPPDPPFVVLVGAEASRGPQRPDAAPDSWSRRPPTSQPPPAETSPLRGQETSPLEETGAHEPSTEVAIERVLDMRGANLAGADLRGRDLSGYNLTDANLTDANLTDANLTDANLTGACLIGARLVRAVLPRARLHGAELARADLTGAILEHAVLSQAGFGDAVLKDAVFFEADLRHASFVGADLSGADLRCVQGEGARFRRADLRGVDFSGADLSHADLVQTQVRGACFHEVDFRRARLRHLEGFENALFLACDIRDVDFSQAYLLRRFIMDQNYLAELRNRSRYHAMLYWLWWATSDCGRSLARLGVWIAMVTVFFGVAYQQVAIDYGGARTWLSPYYFSLVTLTTLGYGDVLPASVAGQALVMSEVVVGYLLLGGLISIFANKMARRAE